MTDYTVKLLNVLIFYSTLLVEHGLSLSSKGIFIDNQLYKCMLTRERGSDIL